MFPITTDPQTGESDPPTTTTGVSTTPPGYTVRQFRPGDREAYLDLYETVFEGSPDTEWFAWKYEHNPYVDHVPIVVAEVGDELVGARSFFGLDMETGSRRVTALQPCDTMVHADHRRQGLFTRMTEVAIERYSRADVPFFFNFPNANSLPGNLKLGWRVVTEAPTAYRVQYPGHLLESQLPPVVGRATADVADLCAGGYHRLRRRLAVDVPDDVTVERQFPVPARKFATLHREDRPRGFQPVRDETFYQWRFENPNWAYTSYLARRDGSVVAGLVVGTRSTGDSTLVHLTDVVPVVDQDPDALTALLGAVLDDYQRAAVIAGATHPFPPNVLSAFGFVRDDTFPLSRATRPTTLVARPLPGSTDADAELTGEDWTVDGKRLDSGSNWTVSFSEQDWC